MHEIASCIPAKYPAITADEVEANVWCPHFFVRVVAERKAVGLEVAAWQRHVLPRMFVAPAVLIANSGPVEFSIEKAPQ
jgi:hypothetical protein